MPGPIFEGNPVGEGTTRRGTATPVHRPQRPAGSTHSRKRCWEIQPDSYWPQLRHCLLFRARTQAYLEKGLGADFYKLSRTTKSPPTRQSHSRGTPKFPAPLHLGPFSPPDRDRRVDSPVLP